MSLKKNTKIIVDASNQKLDGIKSRLESAAILEEDKKIILSILSAYQWLHGQLNSTKSSIRRLKNFFGFSTEKRRRSSKNTDDSNVSQEINDNKESDCSADTLPTLEVPPTKKS